MGLIKHIHDVINLFYYKHLTDKWKYIPYIYIYVTHKVLKSCRSKMATLEHDVCDVHGTSSLYIKSYLQSLYRVFPTGRMGESPHQPKFCWLTASPTNFYSIPPKVNSTQYKNKIVIFSCSHSSCTIFVLISYSFETPIMLILILIDVQYLQNAVFSFEKFSNRQNHSSSDPHHLVKKSPTSVHYFLTQSQGNS